MAMILDPERTETLAQAVRAARTAHKEAVIAVQTASATANRLRQDLAAAEGALNDYLDQKLGPSN